MSSTKNTCGKRRMAGLDRSPVQQARVNAENALRVLEMVPRVECGLVPHPLDVAKAEMRNILLYLAVDNC